MKSLVAFITLILIFSGCQPEKRLPVLGRKEVNTTNQNGKTVADTIYHTIADFQFTNQLGQTVSHQELEGQIYVSDFFFTTCPDICPKMSAQMLRLYETYKERPEVALISYTIDPRHDSVTVLKDYADKLGVEAPKWHFLTGDQDEIYKLGQTSYLVTASESPLSPGGFLHSGAFILVDKQRRIRGIYDGTDPEAVDKLIADIPILLNEYQKQ